MRRCAPAATALRLGEEAEIVATLKRMAPLWPQDRMLPTRMIDVVWQSGCSESATRVARQSLL